MTFLLWWSLAWADPPGPVDDLVEDVGGGRINWTTLQVEVTRDASGSGTRADRRAVEQLARDKVGDALSRVAPSVRVNDSLELEDLLADPTMRDPVSSRLTRWTVTECRYYASGTVEIEAALSLQKLLKPWTMAQATSPQPAAEQPRQTGLIVDARGTGVQPAWAPRIVGHDGSILYDGHLWTDEAIEGEPVIYVPDPAHPAASRAGETPFLVRATSADGVNVVLSQEESLRFRTALAGARFLGSGHVVFVADP